VTIVLDESPGGPGPLLTDSIKCSPLPRTLPMHPLGGRCHPSSASPTGAPASRRTSSSISPLQAHVRRDRHNVLAGAGGSRRRGRRGPDPRALIGGDGDRPHLGIDAAARGRLRGPWLSVRSRPPITTAARSAGAGGRELVLDPGWGVRVLDREPPQPEIRDADLPRQRAYPLLVTRHPGTGGELVVCRGRSRAPRALLATLPPPKS
jgi:hypothetical protein